MEDRSIFYDIVDNPITSVVITICAAVWFYLNQKVVPVEKVSFCYDKVVGGHEYWRGVTASFSHYSLLHLVFNCVSLFQLGFLEHYLGILGYIKITFLLLVLSFVVQITVYAFLIKLDFHADHYRNVHAVGYSCVVFGLMTLASVIGSKISVLGFQVPLSFTPFVSLLVTQLIVPRASFVGHLSGIIGGYLVAWRAFAWMTDYLFMCAGIWVLILLVWSVKRTLNPEWLRFLEFNTSSSSSSSTGSSSNSPASVRIVDGVLVRNVPQQEV